MVRVWGPITVFTILSKGWLILTNETNFHFAQFVGVWGSITIFTIFGQKACHNTITFNKDYPPNLTSKTMVFILPYISHLPI